MLTLYVFFFLLTMFFLFSNVLAFLLALLGFGGKTLEEQRSRNLKL